MQPPKKIAALAGWAGAAFLVGIALHSLQPYRSANFVLLSLAIALFLTAFFFVKKIPWIQIVLICAIALCVGIWRFETVRPSLPRGLIPLSPRGFAFQTNSGATSNAYDPRYWLGRSRTFLTERANHLFAPDEAALLTGILYGERGLSKTTKDQFRRAGLLHIIAVSGSNVTIFVVLLMPILLACRLSRRQAFIGLSIILFLFVLFVNPGASVVRAAIMGWLIELAPLIGRIPRPSRLLLLAAVGFTAWQPWALFYDPSFALSFLAMWGLLTWSPFFSQLLQKKLPWNAPREILSATLGATIMTIPYTAWAFGQVTIFGLLTSLLVLPLIPWVMIFGIFSLLIPNLPLVTLPTQGLLDVILLVARLPDVIPWGVWLHLSTPFSIVLTCYILLFLFWRLIQRKNKLIHRNHAFTPQNLSSPSIVSAQADD